eukprot:2532214-Rhodomonas_salina.2
MTSILCGHDTPRPFALVAIRLVSTGHAVARDRMHSVKQRLHQYRTCRSTGIGCTTSVPGMPYHRHRMHFVSAGHAVARHGAIGTCLLPPPLVLSPPPGTTALCQCGASHNPCEISPRCTGIAVNRFDFSAAITSSCSNSSGGGGPGMAAASIRYVSTGHGESIRYFRTGCQQRTRKCGPKIASGIYASQSWTCGHITVRRQQP